jgi:hypothetical protein
MKLFRMVAVLVLMATTCLVLTGFNLAQPQTLIKVAPQTIQVGIGKQTTADLAIERVSDLYGLQLRIKFDPEVLEVVDADSSQEGIQIEPGTLPAPDFIVLNNADNQAGTIDYALTQMPPREPSSGDGVIARITFQGKAASVSQVQFDQYLLANTEGDSIEATPQHGQIQVVNRQLWVLVAAAGTAVLLIVGGSIGFIITKRK